MDNTLFATKHLISGPLHTTLHLSAFIAKELRPFWCLFNRKGKKLLEFPDAKRAGVNGGEVNVDVCVFSLFYNAKDSLNVSGNAESMWLEF